MKDGEKSLAKVFNILEVISDSPNGISSTELIKRLGMPSSTVFRMLKFLNNQGYVKKDKNYVLGNRVLRLGVIASKQNSLLSIAHPFLVELAKRTGETVHLAELKGDQVIYVDKVEGSRSIRMASMIGHINPAYCTGIGKAILAFLPTRELDGVIDNIKFERFTDTTITGKQALRNELATIRNTKVAIDRCEHESGVFCVASPILDAWDRPVAAISVAGAEIYLKERVEEFSELVVEATEKVSKEMRGASSKN